MQFARLGQVAIALCLLEFDSRPIEQFLDFCFGSNLVLFGLPTLRKLRRFLLEIDQLAFKGRQPVFRSIVGFLAQRLPLDFQLDNPPVEVLDLFGLGLHLHTQARRGLVHEIDRFIGQETVGYITMR